MALKQCINCPPGILKDMSEFHVSRNGRTRDGLKTTCKDCSKTKRQTWAANNRDREREWNAAKYAANPSYFVQKADARKKRLHGNQFIEHVDRVTVYRIHGGCCGICKYFVSEDDFHVDHIIPLSKGGMHGYVNVQLAHPFCNKSKKDKVLT